jgi:hypothetical protein
LDQIIALDVAHPGLAGHVFRASSERRNVIAAYVSVSMPRGGFRSSAEVGWFLVHANHDCILRAAFGFVPTGYRGALARTAVEIQPPRYYLYLHRLLSRHDDVSLLRLVQRRESLDLTRLRIARMLTPDLRSERLVKGLVSLDHAADLVRAVRLLELAGVDRAGMAGSLRTITTFSEFSKVLQRWALKASLPGHPVPANAEYRPITTGEDLRRTALRFRNCMRNYLPSMLESRSAFAAFQHGDQEAIVHLVRRDERWELERLYGTANRPVTPELRSRAENYLATYHIGSRRRSTAKRRYDPLRHLIGGYDPEEPDDGY